MNETEAKKAGFRTTTPRWVKTWRVVPSARKILELETNIAGIDDHDFPTRAKARAELKRRKMDAAAKREDDAKHAKMLEDGKTQMTPITPEQAKMLRVGDEFFYILGINIFSHHLSSCLNTQTWKRLAEGLAYFTSTAAQTALDKQKSEADPEPPKWCERTKGTHIQHGDNVTYGSHDLQQEFDASGSSTYNGWCFVTFASEWANRLVGDYGLCARYHNPAHIEWEKRQSARVGYKTTPPEPVPSVEKQEADGWTKDEIAKAAFKHGEVSDTILDEAAKCVSGPRRHDYGTPDENFGMTAALWSIQLKHEVTPMQVAMCLILLKVARQNNSPKRDNLVDIAGYAQCASELTGTNEIK